MSFKTRLQTDSILTFLNSNEFAEEILYTAKGAAEKSIKAIVERKPPGPDDGSGGRVIEDALEVSIANNATYGIATVTIGADKVSFPKNIGGTDIEWLVTAIVSQDEGMWRLLVTR